MYLAEKNKNFMLIKKYKLHSFCYSALFLTIFLRILYTDCKIHIIQWLYFPVKRFKVSVWLSKFVNLYHVGHNISTSSTDLYIWWFAYYVNVINKWNSTIYNIQGFVRESRGARMSAWFALKINDMERWCQVW